MALPAVSAVSVPCLEALELHFFVESTVNRGLSLYNVREELWLPINMDLQAISKGVPNLMKERTAYRVPNPLEYPMQKFATAEVLKDVLHRVFMRVMNKYHIDVRWKVDAIFNYIFEQQEDKFSECFGSEVKILFTND